MKEKTVGPWLTPKEAADYLKTTERSVRKLITSGSLMAKQRTIRGKGDRPHYFIRVADAERYMTKLPDAGFKPDREVKEKKMVSKRGPILDGVIEFV